MNLTAKESRQATREGWGIFDATDSVANRQGNWPLQIQRIDEQSTFADDHEAHAFVINKAKRGSTLHLKALMILRQESKPELAAIYSLTVGTPLTTEQSQLTHDDQLDGFETQIFGKVVTRV